MRGSGSGTIRGRHWRCCRGRRRGWRYQKGRHEGTFTIAMTIPIAVFIGLYMKRLSGRGGWWRRRSSAGLLVLAGWWLGRRA